MYSFQANRSKHDVGHFYRRDDKEEESGLIEVSPYTNDPTFAWSKLVVRYLSLLKHYITNVGNITNRRIEQHVTWFSSIYYVATFVFFLYFIEV